MLQNAPMAPALLFCREHIVFLSLLKDSASPHPAAYVIPNICEFYEGTTTTPVALRLSWDAASNTHREPCWACDQQPCLWVSLLASRWKKHSCNSLEYPDGYCNLYSKVLRKIIYQQSFLMPEKSFAWCVELRSGKRLSTYHLLQRKSLKVD